VAQGLKKIERISWGLYRCGQRKITYFQALTVKGNVFFSSIGKTGRYWAYNVWRNIS